jgi:signal transduction histidine kinase
MKDGRLSVIGTEDPFLQESRFDPLRMVAWFQAHGDAAIRDGFTAFRAVGEVISVWTPSPSVARLHEFESRLNQLVVGRPISLMCTYDRSRFAPALVRESLATHPLVAVGDIVSRNPHYVLPADYLAGDRPAREVARIVEGLRGRKPEDAESGLAERRERGVARRLLEAHEAERRSLARELHDDLSQVLAGIHLKLEQVHVVEGDERTAELAEITALVEEATEYVRSLSLDLRPSLLDDLGLAAALRSLVRRQAQRGGIEIHLDVASLEEARVSRDLATTGFRLVQEALTNVVRHAGAERAAVTVGTAGGSLEIAVRDDGHGFDVADVRRRAAQGGHLGLLGMEERSALAGGRLTVESGAGGTTVHARLPLTPASAS